MKQVYGPISVQKKLGYEEGARSEPLCFHTVQVIYHNATSQSLFGGPKLQREKARGDLRKAWAASLLFQFDP